jgi:hypothetical protein
LKRSQCGVVGRLLLPNAGYPVWTPSQLPAASRSTAAVNPAQLRHAMQLTRALLRRLCDAVEARNVRTTHELDLIAARAAHALRAYPAPLQYHGQRGAAACAHGV